jgi:hypothetical protein
MMRTLPNAGAAATAVMAAAAALALAGGAMAQGVAQASHTQADVASWTGTPDTLIHMIDRIQATTGGKVLEIRYTTADGMPGFRAVVAEGRRTVFLRAAENGDSVTLSEASMPDWMLRWRSRKDIAVARQASVPLDQAIRTAEAADGGAPAIAAGIAASDSNTASGVKAYNVLLARGGAVRRIAVDDRSGEVIADPQALAMWP